MIDLVLEIYFACKNRIMMLKCGVKQIKTKNKMEIFSPPGFNEKVTPKPPSNSNEPSISGEGIKSGSSLVWEPQRNLKPKDGTTYYNGFYLTPEDIREAKSAAQKLAELERAEKEYGLPNPLAELAKRLFLLKINQQNREIYEKEPTLDELNIAEHNILTNLQKVLNNNLDTEAGLNKKRSNRGLEAIRESGIFREYRNGIRERQISNNSLYTDEQIKEAAKFGITLGADAEEPELPPVNTFYIVQFLNDLINYFAKEVYQTQKYFDSKEGGFEGADTVAVDKYNALTSLESKFKSILTDQNTPDQSSNTIMNIFSQLFGESIFQSEAGALLEIKLQKLRRIDYNTEELEELKIDPEIRKIVRNMFILNSPRLKPADNIRLNVTPNDDKKPEAA